MKTVIAKSMTSIVSISFLIGLSSGCKKAAEKKASQTKTLNSIATGKLDIDGNQCQGDRSAAITDKSIVFDSADLKPLTDAKKTEMRDAVKSYFSALPPAAEALFLKLGGEVFISSNAESLCAASHFGKQLDASQGETTDGCFAYVSDPAKKMPSIYTIIQSPDAKKIKYYGPQIIGYLYAQFYSRLDLAANGKSVKINDVESMAFINMKENVANAFLEDLLALKDYNFEPLKNLIGASSATELRGSSSKLPMDRLSAMADEGRRRQVRDYIFANSFQSAHCNSASLAEAKSTFKKSAELFQDIDAKVIELSQQLIGESNSSSDSKPASKSKASESGFSLSNSNPMSVFMPLLNSGNSVQSASASSQNVGAMSGMMGGILQMLMGSNSFNGNNNGFNNNSYNNNSYNNNNSSGGMLSSMFGSLSRGGCSGGGCNGCSGGSCSGGCSGGCSTGGCSGCSGCSSYSSSV